MSMNKNHSIGFSQNNSLEVLPSQLWTGLNNLINSMEMQLHKTETCLCTTKTGK